MPLSREAQQVSQDLAEAVDVYRERKISPVSSPNVLDPVALTIQIARLIGEERRGSKAGSRVNIGTDPVSIARRTPKIPFAPTTEPEAEVSPRRSHQKRAVKLPVAPRAKAEPKARSRSSRRR